MIGTTANLLHGDQVSIYQLIHGLMLPSGNDAAMCLAENFVNYSKKGRVFIPAKEPTVLANSEIKAS